MSLSIGDLISQFKDPEPESDGDMEASGALAWFKDLQDWLENSYEKTVHHDRKPGLHASGLGSVCARRNILVEVYGSNYVPNTAGNYFTFDVGHALHYWWQERYLGPKGELYGDWMCTACPCPSCGPHVAKLGDISRDEKRKIYRKCDKCRGTGRKVTRGTMPLDCECGVSWQDAIHYLEMPVHNEELDYVGHCDGVLLHEPNRVFEFKTISPSEYEKMLKRSHPYERGPKIDHIIQAHAYMEPLGLEEALIVYENKGSQCGWSVNMFGQFQAKDPKVVPYVVKFDQELWDSVKARIHEHHRSLRVIRGFKDEGKRLPRAEISNFSRVCDSKKCHIAQRCPVSRECFSHD